jgi:hypothetical protein
LPHGLANAFDRTQVNDAIPADFADAGPAFFGKSGKFHLPVSFLFSFLDSTRHYDASR